MKKDVDLERMSLSTRKIENGFILRKSGVDAKGNYVEKETFSPTKPKVMISTGPEKSTSKPKSNPLRDAIKK